MHRPAPRFLEIKRESWTYRSRARSGERALLGANADAPHRAQAPAARHRSRPVGCHVRSRGSTRSTVSSTAETRARSRVPDPSRHQRQTARAAGRREAPGCRAKSTMPASCGSVTRLGSWSRGPDPRSRVQPRGSGGRAGRAAACSTSRPRPAGRSGATTRGHGLGGEGDLRVRGRRRSLLRRSLPIARRRSRRPAGSEWRTCPHR